MVDKENYSLILSILMFKSSKKQYLQQLHLSWNIVSAVEDLGRGDSLSGDE